MKFNYIIIISISFLLFSCGSARNFTVVKPNEESGKFPAGKELSLNELEIFTPIDNFNQYEITKLNSGISTPPGWTDEYLPFLKEMLMNCGLPEIKNNQGTENYLVVDAYLQYHYEDIWTFSINIYDPVSSTARFQASRRATNWFGMGKPIFYPVFNSVKEWVDQSKEFSTQ